MSSAAHLSSRDYADWKAPSGDGQTLIWPEPASILEDARRNHAVLYATETRIQNTPLRQLRASMRDFIGQPDSDALLFATGHQTELYHAGVWSKDLLIDAMACRAHGQALHIAVDTDQPKHLNVRWPGESMPITDDPGIATLAWSGLLAPPTPAHLQSIETAAAERWQATRSDWPMLFELLHSLRRLCLESSTLSSMLTNAQHEVDWSLGLKQHSMLVSPMLLSESYLAFAHHLMAQPDEFAAAYNGSLAEYRSLTGATNPMRPMPDLFAGSEAIESPFWLDNLSISTRSRPSLFRSERGWTLQLIEGDTFEFDAGRSAEDAASGLRAFLQRTNHRLAPRALTLTTFLRLFIADQFVHGIGGGRYDQVTDRLIERFFQIAPPRFAVTTATMFLPEALGRERVCLPCVKQVGHRLKHSLLGNQKREMVAQIASLPRRSGDREAIFVDLHRQRRKALSTSSKIAEWEAALRDTQAKLQEEEVLFDRELSYTLQPRTRLLEMIERYRAAE